MTKQWAKVVSAVLGGALVVGVAAVAGRSVGSSNKVSHRLPSATTASTAGGLVEFRDEKAGWAISYPKVWTRLQSHDADVALVVSEKAPELNTGGSILARDLTLGAPVTEANLAAAREVTDKVVTGGQGTQQLAQPTVVHQGGLPGYFYFYRFKDPATGRDGVHTHYFLFKGSTMISFVFQALPKEDFPGLATVYDQVMSSFRVL
jgi:hypothetical protein